MGSKWVHKIIKKDKISGNGICKVCGEIKLRKKGNRYLCRRSQRRWEFGGGHSYKSKKLQHCSLCGFVPKHKCQLDVDHIDGNKKNNKVENLMTLCANCHRLKTFNNQQWKTRY